MSSVSAGLIFPFHDKKQGNEKKTFRTEGLFEVEW